MVALQLAIVRFVPRDTSQPTVFAGSPLPPAPDRPGCLLLNKLPFQVLRSTGTLLMPPSTCSRQALCCQWRSRMLSDVMVLGQGPAWSVDPPANWSCGAPRTSHWLPAGQN